ncbi:MULTISPECIES: SDR family oxidoreductase [unclassified Streptomyces]|uniref:SDR family oxidoreductase n=1 Tax=unclassified Streptomyces TaxID=2593676 RepID=UPI0036FF2D4F
MPRAHDTAGGPLAGRVVLLTGPGDTAALLTERLGARGALVVTAADGGDDPDRTVGRVVRDHGRLDHLVNVVAVPSRARALTDLAPSDLNDVLGHGLVTPLTWIQRAHAHRMAAHGGSVVNVVPDGPRDGLRDAALAALTELTEWLAAELAPRVAVHTVLPGPRLENGVFRAGLADIVTGLLACPRPARPDPVHGPVLVLTGAAPRPRRAA